MLVVNFALIVIITLWLAIKAHRKVLDYFVRNGALLPMVAACSKRSFYGALWILTVSRVLAFLAAAVPMTVVVFLDLLGKEDLKRFFQGDIWALMLWGVTLVLSMSLATVIASIAELRQRHEILSFLYKYLPIFVSLLGGVIWVATFIFEGNAPSIIRQFLTACPIIGMVPVLIAPLFSPYAWLLVVNMVLTAALLAVTLNFNARWFAAHLEEL
jgi:hypothetical protein